MLSSRIAFVRSSRDFSFLRSTSIKRCVHVSTARNPLNQQLRSGSFRTARPHQVCLEPRTSSYKRTRHQQYHSSTSLPIPQKRGIPQKDTLVIDENTGTNNNTQVSNLDDDGNPMLRLSDMIKFEPDQTPRRKKLYPKQSSKQRKKAGFVDVIRLRTKGGNGGNGGVSHKSMGSYKKRPDGGDGGSGGRVILVADPTLSSLSMSKHHYGAEVGKDGGANKRNGKNGRDVIVRVPTGVVVRRVMEEEEVWDEELEMFVKPKVEEEEEWSEEDWETYYASNEEINEGYDKESDDENGSGSGSDSSDSDSDDSDDEVKGETYVDSDSDDSDSGSDSDSDYDSDNEERKGTYDSDSDDSDSYDSDDDSDGKKYNSSASDPNNKHIRHQTTVPSQVINSGRKAKDGFYYWQPPEQPPSFVDLSELPETNADPDHVPFHLRPKHVLADLNHPGSYCIVANGGRNGRGNSFYATHYPSAHRRNAAAARAQPLPGELSHLELELKLLADVGLVGYPNAGKSSLLQAMSRASPAIAPYPFTTLHPNLGVLEYRDGKRVCMGDVPGLIHGAHMGKGRGIDFLRHLERTRILLYIVDLAGVDGRDGLEDLKVLSEELRSYEAEDFMTGQRIDLLDRPAIVVGNKIDLLLSTSDEGKREEDQLLLQEELKELEAVAHDCGIDIATKDDSDVDEDGNPMKHVYGISAGVTGEGLRELSAGIRNVVMQSEEASKEKQEEQ